jgi:aspartyl-tRNA(Asn)/glutamyl-tRNA(Gln) amidotransferase subunit A
VTDPGSASEIARRIRSRELCPVEVVAACLRRIEEKNPLLNAFVALRSERALAEARALAGAIAAGRDPGPLAGVPIGVKDLEDVGGMVTSFGSPIHRDHVAPADSVQVARLRAAGAVVVGKTNTPEFGYTVLTKNRLYGVTRNPRDPGRTPGGSSGGSAAAVAGGLVPLATGSDAGGSIRLPASYCGCLGLKPSLGRIPQGSFPGPRDLLCMSPMAVPGPLSRTVEDAALYLDCTAGEHPSDPTSLPRLGGSYAGHLDELPQGLRIAFSPGPAAAPLQADVRALAEAAARVFEDLGHEVELWPWGLPDAAEDWSALVDRDFYAQVAGDLEGDRGREMGRGLRALLERVPPFPLADQLRAQRARTEVNRVLWKLFDRYDLLLTPTTPNEAFAAEGPPPGEIGGRPASFLDFLAFTYPFSVSGHPAASVPAGLTASGLPAGLQIVGARHRDDLVLQAARAFERARPWYRGGAP